MKIESYKYVLWDWNGTLLDDAWLCREIINSFLQKRNLPTVSFERYRSVFGFPVIEYYRKLGLDLEEESFERLAHDFVEIYYRRVSECRLHQHSLTLLHAFREQNVGQSLLSAAHQKNLLEMVRHFGIEDYFDFIVGLNDHYAAGKAELGQQLVQQISCTPREMLFIGDTTHDFEVARKLDTGCLLVAHGHHSAERLQECGVPVYRNFQELL